MIFIIYMYMYVVLNMYDLYLRITYMHMWMNAHVIHMYTT